ncbi:phospholipase DDHD2-like isoform X1 [Saccostrea echinata]|uniref:phospholipase DDHD2-like isoform X1 n=1 Tax=Saccostrea echinata TaxID=191078 RepID=UPI002A801FB1|nr:phospholipase DDHD2-like isoform X1 [Saccostrea echinata]
MADKGKKDTTPPPLLLMPAGGGLTLNPPTQSNLLMPVVQSEPSLLGSDEEGEADSFVGQTPPQSSQSVTHSTPFSHFQNTPSGSDPFAHVGHNPLPPQSTPRMQSNVAAPMPPPSFASPTPAGPPPGPSSANAFRKTESLRKVQYAQMPQGTYAPTGGGVGGPPQFQGQPPLAVPSSGPSMFSPPPVAQVPPTMNQTHQPPSSQSPMPPKPSFTATVPPPSGTGATVEGSGIYIPVQPHWCFCKKVENRDIWYPFSLVDSMRLEDALRSGKTSDPIPTEGGRYDAILSDRQRVAVYWEESPNPIRRCTWFYKREGDNRYVPYEEHFAQKLEEEYRNALQYNTWHKRLEFPGGETIVMHNANVIVHFTASSQPDEWGSTQAPSSSVGEGMRPRVVKRGIEDFQTINDGEPIQIDHLVFVVHGIGDFCDVKFRNIIECVDDFRSISLSLLKSHFGTYVDQKRIGRVEFIPVQWHSALHGDTTGLDKRLKAITLPSTPKLRNFINDTLLDVLFYTSPTYCQTIADQVGNEMNRLHQLFLERNPQFQGTVSVAGHSLGSCVLFDLLMHQNDKSDQSIDPSLPSEPIQQTNGVEMSGLSNTSFITETEEIEKEETTLEKLLSRVGLQDKVSMFEQEQIDLDALTMCTESDLKDLGLPMGPRKKLQGILKEEQAKKEKRKHDKERKIKESEERRIREQVAAEMREARASQEKSLVQSSSSVSVEFLLGPAGTGQPSVKYPKLDFKPNTLYALGSPIGIFLSARGVDNIGEEFTLPTCPRVFNIFHPFDPVAYRLEPLVNPSASHIKPVLMPHHKGRKRLHLELKESLTRVGADIKQKIIDSLKSTWNTINEFAKAHRNQEESLEQHVDSQMSSVMQELDDDQSSVASSQQEDIYMGQLNEGHRIDFVLQERPIESFNDYLFALSSHGCYWESEDTVLLVLKELYSPQGMTPQMPGPEGAVKLYNTAASPPRGSVPPPMSQYPSPPSNQPVGVPLMTPPSHGPPPMRTSNMMPPRGSVPSPYMNPGMNSGPPPQPASFGPPPLAGFVKPPQK